MPKGKTPMNDDANEVSRETSSQDNGFKPVMFFAQSAKLMIGNPDAQKETRFTSGQIATEEAVIRFEGHFYQAKTQQEYDLIMRLYPPRKDGDGKIIPNKLVTPVTPGFVAKYNNDEYLKRQRVRRTQIPVDVITPEIDEEAVVRQFDGQ